MANKKTPVTSVTPKSTVKPVSKAQQARTRKLIAGIASVTPVGRAAAAVKAATKVSPAVKAEVRALKAANKPTRASKNPDVGAVKRIAEANRSLNMKEPYATRNAQETVDAINKHFGRTSWSKTMVKKPKSMGYKNNPNPPKKAVIKKKSK